jgi:hypothetical protein
VYTDIYSSFDKNQIKPGAAMTQNQNNVNQHFPYRAPIRPILTMGWLLTIATGLTLLLGIVFPNFSYHTAALKENFYLNDFASLTVGLPLLILSLFWWKQTRLVALLIRPGVLFFFIYNYLIYLLSIPFNFVHILYGMIMLISLLMLLRLHRATEAPALEDQLRGRVHERLAGILPLVFGLLFLARAAGMLATTRPISSSEIALNVADILISLVWIIAGLTLLSKKPLGYRYSVPALVSGGMLMIALLVFLALQPLLGLPFSIVDFGVILFGTVLFLVPLGLVWKGLRTAHK